MERLKRQPKLVGALGHGGERLREETLVVSAAAGLDVPRLGERIGIERNDEVLAVEERRRAVCERPHLGGGVKPGYRIRKLSALLSAA